MPDQLLGITSRLAALEEREKAKDAAFEKIKEEQQGMRYRMDTGERRMDKAEGKLETHSHKLNEQSNKQDLLQQEMGRIMSDLTEIKEDTKYTRRQSTIMAVGFVSSLLVGITLFVINTFVGG